MFAAKETKREHSASDSMSKVRSIMSPSMARNRAPAYGESLPDSFHALERDLGNSYIQSLAGSQRPLALTSALNDTPVIHRKCACGGTCTECKDQDTAQRIHNLPVSHPGDPLERQADQLSDFLMSQISVINHYNPGQGAPVIGDADGVIEEEGLIDGDSMIRSPGFGNRTRAELGHSSKISSGLNPISGTDGSTEINLRGAYGPGQPIETGVRSVVEPLLGHDLSAVRIYPNEAHKLAKNLNARAFTLGRHIYFDQGEYGPHSQEGMRVLLHELVHTTQGADTNGVVMRSPRISGWNFHNANGAATAADNCCALCPRPLGVGNKYAGRIVNGMELQALIADDEPGAAYDIKRVKERSSWQKIGGTWNNLTHVGPGADDDPDNLDECLTPTTSPGHIYSEDQPGFARTAGLDPTATEAVYKASFTESVEIVPAGGGGYTDATMFDWHSTTWLTKASGTWDVDAAKSEIAPGSVTVGTAAP
jgi:hypothetical protein